MRNQASGAAHLAGARQRLQGLKGDVPDPDGGKEGYQPKGKEGSEDGPAFRRRSVDVEDGGGFTSRNAEIDEVGEPWAGLGAEMGNVPVMPILEVF